MKLISGENIPDRVLIKPLREPTKTTGGLEIPVDNEQLPKAEIIQVTPKVQEILKLNEGDIVYYIENSRNMGTVTYQGEGHYVLEIGNIVAII